MLIKGLALATLVVVTLHGSTAYSQGQGGQPAQGAPATTCTVLNYAAYADPANDQADAYMFSGACTMNVAPEGKTPSFEKVDVRIEGEWSPKMKRASETVRVARAASTHVFSTWATCDDNPFLMGPSVACKNQGMGGADFAFFLRREDAPFAKGRVDPSRVAALTARAGSRNAIRYVGLIKSLDLLPDLLPIGKEGTVKVNFIGGPSACPMDVDFGDGYVLHATSPDETTSTAASHAYKTAGVYSVTARALPGCSGSATGKITVTSAGLPAPPPPDGKGELVAVAVGGSCTWSINGASKGTSSQLKIMVPPGTYSVTCKPAEGATKSRTVIVKAGQPAMAMFKLTP